ncbi:SWIM zinc finger family protein [Frankia sp. AgKG'84/4]|uniref:SWIM zinc finger family protein n=1 Tax=Frankia sp. AgKG'84/4 TaxID=573490 RepID=UPI00200D4D0B|nr:SWIM zinc finger family protein [Frankia sp. AgKG'84/4]MCL9795779.1 SWIM zinc finger family protein [Frankia sp. AgKG'84/4]
MIISVSGENGHDGDPVTPLEAAFEERACAQRAGTGVFIEGVNLALLGRVEQLRIRPTNASGTVEDDGPQEVRLEAADDGPRTGCTCPEGATGSFCRHAVAVALVATGSAGLAEDDEDADEETGGIIVESSLFADDPVHAAMRVFLSRVPRGELVETLLDAAEENEAVADALWEATVAWHGRQHGAAPST